MSSRNSARWDSTSPAYVLSVMRGSAWRRIAATFGTGTPAAKSSLAQECRRSCGATGKLDVRKLV